MLMSQKDQIAKLAPAGLSNVLGLKSLTDLGSVADSVKAAGAGAAREFGRTATAAASQGTAVAPLGGPAGVTGGGSARRPLLFQQHQRTASRDRGRRD